MDHEAVGRTQAVERYLHGEMADVERDEFEAHYFSCVICGQDVQAGFLFRENARVVLRQPREERPWWQRWWPLPVPVPAFAAVALAAVVLFQNTVTLPQLRAPRALPAAVILDGATRDSLPKLKEGAPLRFQMAVDNASASGTLLVELADEANRVLRSGTVAAPAANHALDVYFPGTIKPGRYTIILRSVPAGLELARNSFRTVKESGAE
jgi:hypothetical protein